MKKYLAALLLIAVLMLSLVSCTDDFIFIDHSKDKTEENENGESGGDNNPSGGENNQSGGENNGGSGDGSGNGGSSGSGSGNEGIPENDQYPGWGTPIPY